MLMDFNFPGFQAEVSQLCILIFLLLSLLVALSQNHLVTKIVTNYIVNYLRGQFTGKILFLKISTGAMQLFSLESHL